MQQQSLVLTVDFGDDSAVVGATLTDYDIGRVESLAMSSPADTVGRAPLTDTAGWAPLDVVREGLTRAAVASARAVGIVTAPHALVLTHPTSWTVEQIAVLHRAADAAGYDPDAVIVHPAVQRRSEH